ncbi:DUF1176 domain-containing protein [uncultured Thiothrix sp.]|uniref:DUF1176 domain-containing protein n=1 Tax=uncultured Thiothrix sp. TaxID=223185 RepID=UPI00262EB11A|nr:DUF1176 domain-containing protein [uncultured Thiothrix sp.]
MVIVAPKGKPEAAQFAKFDHLKEKALIVGEMNGYDSTFGQLFSSYRSNTLGDCGSSSDWVWTGNEFKLSSYYAMPECRGVFNFLSVWKLAVEGEES